MSNQKEEKSKPKKKGLNYMKRQGVIQGFSRLSMFILFPVFFGTAIFMFAAPRSEESQIEKRTLEKFPEFTFESLLSGEYTQAVTQWYDDTVPYRDDFKNIGNDFKNLFGLHTDDNVTVIGQPVTVADETSKDENSKNSGENHSSENSEKDSDSQNQSETSNDDEGKYQVENGIIVAKQNGHYRALELFGGGTGEDYTNALNKLHGALGDSVTIYSMIAPLASEFYTPEDYNIMNASQKEYIEKMSKNLDEGIVSVEITDILAEHKDENIYFRTDHHWTPLGGYYASKKFAEAAGVEFKDISTFEEKIVEGFVGTMYGFTGDANLNRDKESFVYYVPDNNSDCTAYYYTSGFKYRYSGDFFNDVGDPQHNAYVIYMGGDDQTVKIKTNVKNGRKLLIVKDSYGNVIPSFLFNSFEEIYVVDMRYFELNLVDFTKQMGITDMLFAMVTYSAFGQNSDNLDNLITQAKGRKIVDEALLEENESSVQTGN